MNTCSMASALRIPAFQDRYPVRIHLSGLEIPGDICRAFRNVPTTKSLWKTRAAKDSGAGGPAPLSTSETTDGNPHKDGSMVSPACNGVKPKGP